MHWIMPKVSQFDQLSDQTLIVGSQMMEVKRSQSRNASAKVLSKGNCQLNFLGAQ